MGFIKFLGWGFVFLVAIVLLVLLIGVLNPSDPNAPPSKYEFRTLVENQLKDSSSAEFRNERIYPVAGRESVFMMCGEVKAKNSYGAYTGFKRFTSGFGGTNGLVLIDDGTAMFAKIWETQCRQPANS